MREDIFKGLGVISLSLIIGCSAAMVPYTKDPQKKLANAKDLFDFQDRPLPAERLLVEAITSFKKSKDDVGLADAYRLYGFFFQSEAVERWEHVYRRQGFLDKTATFEGRKNKALQYFEEARALYSEHHVYDRMTNVDLNLGFAYERNRQWPEACKEFDRAREDYNKNVQDHPNSKPTVPEGFSNFHEFIIAQKVRAKCE